MLSDSWISRQLISRETGRIGLDLSLSALLGAVFCAGLQSEVEGGTVVWLRFDPDTATMCFDQSAAHQQAQPGSLCVIQHGVSQLLKWLEQLGLILFRDTAALVTDRDNQMTRVTFGGYSYLAAFRRVLHTVLQKVIQYSLQPQLIGGDWWQLSRQIHDELVFG
jgi:hypothetical protein